MRCIRNQIPWQYCVSELYLALIRLDVNCLICFFLCVFQKSIWKHLLHTAWRAVHALEFPESSVRISSGTILHTRNILITLLQRDKLITFICYSFTFLCVCDQTLQHRLPVLWLPVGVVAAVGQSQICASRKWDSVCVPFTPPWRPSPWPSRTPAHLR